MLGGLGSLSGNDWVAALHASIILRMKRIELLYSFLKGEQVALLLLISSSL